VLDVIYLALTLALFALVWLIARGAEKLAAAGRATAPHDAMRGEEGSR
jgi:hypothetical protein